MKCYFCKTNILKVQNGHSVWCQSCANTYNLENVVTTYNHDKLEYCHMYVPYTGKAIIETTGYLSYHIRLQFKTNNIYIGLTDNESYGKYVITIPGLLINPSNVKRKLKTILLFS